MKFTCERCGKRFASVDEPTAGRVYRIRCRCGNIIHITSPHAEQDAAKRQGGQPSLDRPRITGATPTGAAMPPIPAGQRSVIPAGDATSRVSLTPSPAARIHDPAVPRRTEPAVRTATGAQRPATSRSPTGTHPAARSVTGSHPLATPASALDASAEPALRFEPALEPREPTPPRSRSPGAKSSSFAIPAPPAKSIPPRGTAAGQPAFGTTADVPLPSRGPATAPPRRKPTRTMPAAEPFDPFAAAAAHAAAPPFDPFAPVAGHDVADQIDPFAAAAAHAARSNPFDTTAPVVSRAAASPAVQRDAAGGAHDAEDEASVDLSVSEQYALPKPKKRHHSGAVAVVTAVLGLAIVGVAGAYVWKTKVTREHDVVSMAPARPVPAPPPPRASPPPAEPIAAAPAPAPVAPAPVAPAPVAPVSAPVAPAPITAVPGPAVPPAVVVAPAPPVPAAVPAPPAPVAPPAVAVAPEPSKAAPPPQPARVATTPQKQARPSKPERAVPPPRAPERKVAAAAPVREPVREPVRSAPAVVERAPDPPKAAPPPPPKAAPPPPPAPTPAPPVPVAAAPARAPAPAAKPAQGLDPALMQSVIARGRPGFDACVEKALQDPVTASYAGRKAALLLLVAPNGKAEAALEDGDLDASPFGACLRRVAAKMGFPAFQGEDVGARIVLVLGRAN